MVNSESHDNHHKFTSNGIVQNKTEVDIGGGLAINLIPNSSLAASNVNYSLGANRIYSDDQTNVVSYDEQSCNVIHANKG